MLQVPKLSSAESKSQSFRRGSNPINLVSTAKVAVGSARSPVAEEEIALH
jgi:hypothetical protein